ncbi:NAD dependent epimerase/dehydratase family protein [Aeromonas diversa CDC 2478-85]|uniref:NAD dependent epimerase/dehydratase family protein n=1 Tax=Aeromonas diversa CDC 2478-85 TaxID=1268237 RepID=N9VMM1_9GAMM|nr:NAD(P)H-binding protein [Aeromonas diversa]ENY72833.1 NAD dependent epimerase/dehydratase family protein [Aeromonas diversa CDC 2478-85]
MKYAVIGAGWLGLPLAEALQQRGDVVAVTCTSRQKCIELGQRGVQAYPYTAGVGEPRPWSDCDVVVVAIPPSKTSDYPAALAEIASHALASGCRHLLLVSATSVYADGQQEGASPMGEGSRAQRLLGAEQAARQSGIARVTILRPSGLYGPDRHPGRFLAGRECSGGARAVNLVHLDDVVNAILLLLDNPGASSEYVISAPGHPTRERFYTQAALALGLPPPRFVPPEGDFLPLSGLRLCQELGFTYRWPDPMIWLNQA